MEELIAIDEDERLDALVDRAAQGEDIALTRKGTVVARIVATPPKLSTEQAEKLIEEFRRLREGQILGDDLTIKDLINDVAAILIVLDASVTGAWFFQDETTAAIEEILRQVADKGAVVPSIWQVEVANTLRTAVRRQRLNARRRQGYFDLLSAMPIEVDEETVSRAWTTTVAFSDRHNLTSYDAAYLELAIRRQLPLATTDRLLINAAIAEGLTVLP